MNNEYEFTQIDTHIITSLVAKILLII